MKMDSESNEKKQKKPTMIGVVSTHKRYLSEGRLEKNRAKRRARHQHRMAEQACKVLAVPRGTARAARREGLLPKEVREENARQALLFQLNAERVLRNLCAGE